jgi:hypothetical protein
VVGAAQQVEQTLLVVLAGSAQGVAAILEFTLEIARR